METGCRSLNILGFGIRPEPGFREWSLVPGGWDIVHLACWPQLWGGVNSLTLTLVLGVPLRTFGPSLRCRSGWSLAPQGPGGARLFTQEHLSLSAAGRLWMSVGSTHLHTDRYVWEWGSQRAWPAYVTSVVLVPRGELNSSWYGVSLGAAGIGCPGWQSSRRPAFWNLLPPIPRQLVATHGPAFQPPFPSRCWSWLTPWSCLLCETGQGSLGLR